MIKKAWAAYAAALTLAVVIGEAANLARGGTGAAAVLAWIHFRRQAWVSRSIVLAALLMVVQVLLSGVASLNQGWAAFDGSGSTWVSTMHLGLSLLIQSALLVGLVAAYASWRSEAGES